MFKTILGKNLAMFISIITISFIILGTSLAQMYKSYFIARQEKILIEQSSKIASLSFEQALANDKPFTWWQYESIIQSEARILKEYLNLNYYVINIDYSILYPTEELIEKGYLAIDPEKIPVIEQVMQGKIVTVEGNLDDLYPEAKLSVFYPVGEGDQVIGAILMSSSMNSLNENISEVVRITVLCVVSTGFITFVLIYFSSRRMSRPLQQMNNAAKVIANGDFEKRIEVTSLDEIGQLANSFNNMARGLERQEVTRREFIANISHDLRSPLTSIIGFLQAIKDGTIPQERSGYYLDIVLDECRRMAKLANDLLDISKSQATGDMDLVKSKFELNEMIRKTAIQFENRISDKNLELEISFADDKNIVFADYEKIQRVFYNLLDNAVKFTPADGKIRIETTVKEKKVYISVKDSGKGIKEEEKQSIFERFYKGDSSRGMDKTGSGLGLSIVKEFIKAHGEKIAVNSVEGMGCEFVFTLNLAEEERA